MTGVRRVLGYDLDQDWAEVYGKRDFTGELVLDVGADRGSTAEFFLSHGARAVICSEPASSVYYRELEGLAARDDKVALVRPVLTEERASGLLEAWRPDTVKLDCEGCEENFVGAIMEHHPKCVLAEVHGLNIWTAFYEALDAVYDVTILSRRSSPYADFTIFRADLT